MTAALRAGIIALAPGMALIFVRQSLWGVALLCILLGIVWLAGATFSRTRGADLGLAGFAAVAAFGAWLGVAPLGMLAGAVAALVLWDLHRFAGRLAGAERVDGAGALVGAHLRRLALVAGLSLGLGALALGVDIALNFGWAFLLALAAVLLLSRALGAAK